MIRFGTHADIPAMLAIGKQVIARAKTLSCELDPELAAKTIRQALNHRKHAVFVAEKAGQVVGFFIALQDQFWFSKTHYATDLAFCVSPEHREQAVWLLRRFIRWCQEHGIAHIQLGLSTGLDEDGRTGRLYEAHGLKLVGGIYSTIFDSEAV